MFVSFNPQRGKPLIGKPDAGKPPVRFGGRGGRNQSVAPTPINATVTGRYSTFKSQGWRLAGLFRWMHHWYSRREKTKETLMSDFPFPTFGAASQMRRPTIFILVALGILVVPEALWVFRSAGAQESSAQVPHDMDIIPAARARIAVSPPAEDRVEVPQRYRGVHVVHDMEERSIGLTSPRHIALGTSSAGETSWQHFKADRSILMK